MRYTEFRLQFSSRSPAADKKSKPEGHWAERGFEVAVVIATALVFAMASLAFADYDWWLAGAAVVAFAAVYYCWQAFDNASWKVDESRYSTKAADAEPKTEVTDPALRREVWYNNHAIDILKKHQITAENLSYLHDASGRAAKLSGLKIAYIAGILAVVAGWGYLLFEKNLENYALAASWLTKIVISVYLIGGVAIFAPVFLKQRFTSIDRIIENTLYDIIHLEEYTPPSAPKPAGPHTKAGVSRGAGATSAHP